MPINLRIGTGFGRGGGDGTPSPFSSVTTATTFFTDDGSALRIYSADGSSYGIGAPLTDPGGLTLKDGNGATVADESDLLTFEEMAGSGCEIQFSSAVMTAGETYTLSLAAGALMVNGLTPTPAVNNYPVTNTLV